MNSITLQGTIISQPELRYTSEEQIPISTSLLEYLQVGQGGEDTPVRVKLQGWGKNNSEALQSTQVGQEVILTGHIRLNTVEFEDGYKQKLAEINLSNLVVVG